MHRTMAIARACGGAVFRATSASASARRRDHSRCARPRAVSTSAPSSASASRVVARAKMVGKTAPEEVTAALGVDDVEDEDPGKNFSGTCGAVDRGGVAVLDGMRSAAPFGAVLTFANGGGRGVLLSHREPKSFALMFEEDESGRRRVDAGEKATGTTAEASKSEFVMGPSAKSTLGKIVNAFGERLDGEKMVTGTEDSSRMIREPPSVEDRKPITTPLVTGIKAVDLLAPIGRGQCMLVSGEPGTGLSDCKLLDSISTLLMLSAFFNGVDISATQIIQRLKYTKNGKFYKSYQNQLIKNVYLFQFQTS